MSWETMRPVAQLYHQGVPIDTPPGEAWFQNARYMASLRREEAKQDDGSTLTLLHISFRRQDRGVERDWRDTQRIKNDLVGPEQEMLELYPSEKRVVDTANQFHLFGIEGVDLPFGWQVDFRMDADETPLAVPGAKQRAFDDV